MGFTERLFSGLLSQSTPDGDDRGSWPGEATARRRLEQNVRSVFLSGQEHQALEDKQNLTVPRALFPSVSQEKLDLVWIQDRFQAGPQAYSVTLSKSVHLPGTWGVL